MGSYESIKEFIEVVLSIIGFRNEKKFAVLIIRESTSPDVGNEYGLSVIFRNQEISDSDSN